MDTSTLHTVFESIIDRETLNAKALSLGAFKRKRKVESYDMVLALLRATSTGPDRSLASTRRAWEALTGSSISQSAFDDHFNPGLVRLLWDLLAKVTVPTARALRRRWPPALQSLRDIVLTDGSRMVLDSALAGVFRGTAEGQASLKLMAVLSLDQGQLTDVRAAAGVHHDRKVLRLGELVAGALYLMDLGFYDHSLFAALDDAKVYFASRLKSRVVPRIEAVSAGVVDARNAIGKRVDSELRCHRTVDIDAAFRTGKGKGTRTFRVVKVEVPHNDRHDNWKGDHHQFWFVTNLPRDTWTPLMIAVLYRLRWAIERAFRQMKSLMRLDHVRSESPTVIFVFVAASLIVWALGATIVRELEMRRGIGRVSHDRVFASLIETLPDLTFTLCRRPTELNTLLRGHAALFNREGKHPNPSQPRRVTTVFDTLTEEAQRLPRAA